MKNLILFFILLCVFFSNGCYKIYFYEKFPLNVVDAETNQPIEGALVRVDYFMSGGGFFVPDMPKRMTDRTDAEGNVKLKRATNSGMWCWLYYIEAEGYFRFNLFQSMNILRPNDQDMERVHFAALYSKPDPMIEIVVPNDYQGPVAIEFVKTNDSNQGKTGQRLFSYHIQENGYVAIEMLPLFVQSQLISTAHHHIYSDESDNIITAKRENGSEVIHKGGQYEPDIQSSGNEPDIIAFRYVCSDGLKILCHIGTEHDRDAMFNIMYPKNRFGLDKRFDSYFKPQTIE